MVEHARRAVTAAATAAGVEHDPHYRATLARFGAAALAPAGFFDDGLTADERHPERVDHRWPLTPVHKLRPALASWLADPTAEAPVVLLSTGGFSPVHDGHLAMMAAARDALEARGRAVLGGYLSPGHDGYVSTKPSGPHRSAEQRLALCDEAVADHPWLLVDPWEARWVGAAVNYTDVLRRLEAYLAVQLGVPVEVAYVFGGDNAGFARAFVDRGVAVCVPRPGAEDAVAAVLADPLLVLDRVLLASTGVDASSSAVRAGAREGVPARVRARLDALDVPVPAHLDVRDDLAWAVEPWLPTTPADLARAEGALDRWRRAVLDALGEAIRPAGSIVVHDLAAQRRRVDEVLARLPVLGLDPCTPATHRLGVARRFAVGDGQLDALGVGARPGWPPLAEQLGAVPAGTWALVDDDVVTGATLAAVRAGLPPGVDLVEVHALLGNVAGDVLDLRDLLPGAREAGLVVELPDGTLARAPYALPHVSPAARLSLPPDAAPAFSVAVWEAAAALFEAWPTVLRVEDASPSSTALWCSLGLDASTPLADVAARHATRLVELPFSPTG